MLKQPDNCPRASCDLEWCPFDYRMRQVCKPLPASPVPGGVGEAGGFSSLDIDVQSRAKPKKQWDTQLKRAYGRVLSFMNEGKGRGCQFLWLNLTTVKGDLKNGEKLTPHFKELRRRIERKTGYRIGYFKVETSEGGGVLHIILAIESKTAVWIGQRWLSAQWLEIHGAHRVWIGRIGCRDKDKRNISRYIVSQYMTGGQGSSFVRFSYSWWRTRLALGLGWAKLKKEHRGMVGVAFVTLIGAWQELLLFGSCELGGHHYGIIERCVSLIT